MRLAMVGQEQAVRTESRILTDARYRLQYVDFLMRSDKVKFKVLGSVRNRNLNLDIETGAGVRREVVPLTETPVLPDDIYPMLAVNGQLKVGAATETSYFDPMTRRYDRVKVRVTQRLDYKMPDGTIKAAFRVESEMAGAKAVTIVTERGRIVEQTMANISMVRETRQSALTENWREKPADLPELARVAVEREIHDPRDTKLLKARIGGVMLDDLSLADERQTWQDGVLTVRVVEPPEKGDFKTPYPGDDPALRRLMRHETLIESDDPAIISQAEKIAPRGVDAVAAANAITMWVYKNLEKKPLVSMAGAKDVLILHRGDCNEHASLFTALARAAGLPAQTHVGLVYLNGAFYYHAWNGVYVGQWIAVDPTFGQFPADATHLRIVSGGLDRQVDLVRMIGEVKIDVLEAE
jgi:transglutaminase-like putative cysteine protease